MYRDNVPRQCTVENTAENTAENDDGLLSFTALALRV
jgi:hypothetical protein